MPQDRIDQAANVLSSVMHQGDNGRQARELLSFDASTMGRADFEAMVEQVQTTEAFSINDLMRQGRHDEAVDRLRADANIFVNHEEFMELAGKVRAMNKVSGSPSHIEFNPIYQNGDQHGRPTAVEVGVATRFQNTSTGQQWEKRDPVKIVDNRIAGENEMQFIEAPPPVVVIQQPPPIIVEQRPQFTFNLEIEIGRERVRRADPRWCPDRNWRPHNAPPGFNLEIEIGRTRDEYRRRGDNDWRPERATPRTVINQINNTTIINNNTTNIDRSRTTIDNSTTNNNTDRSRTRIDSHDRTNDNDRTRVRQGNDGQQGQQQRRETPPQGQENKGQDRRAEAEARRAEAEARRAQQNNGQGQERQQPRREQERQRPNREQEEKERRERKKN